MWKKHVFSNKKLSSMEINGGFSTSRVYHQNGSFLDDFHILEDPTLTRPCVYTYGMIWVDGHICSWFTHKKWMLIFHSFLYVYQRVYVLLYIVYIYIFIYAKIHWHWYYLCTEWFIPTPKKPQWQCILILVAGNGVPPQMIWLRWKMVEKYLNRLRFMVNLSN